LTQLTTHLQKGLFLAKHDYINDDYSFIRCGASRPVTSFGTPGGAKSFLRGAQIAKTMSNTFFQGVEKFSWGTSPPLVTVLGDSPNFSNFNGVCRSSKPSKEFSSGHYAYKSS